MRVGKIVRRRALDPLLRAEEHAAAILVETQSPGVRIDAELFDGAAGVEVHRAVAQRGRPDAASRCRRDVDHPARREARCTIEDGELAAPHADHADVFGSEPQIRSAHRHGLERGRTTGPAPAPDRTAVETHGVERERAGRKEPAAAGREAVDGALADSIFPAEPAAIASEIEPFCGGDVEAFFGRAQIVDHPERSGHCAEAIALEHAETAVERADPQLAPELGQRLDVVAADLPLRGEHLVI